MSLKQYKCPHCGVSGEYAEDSAQVKCVNCGQTFPVTPEEKHGVQINVYIIFTIVCTVILASIGFIWYISSSMPKPERGYYAPSGTEFVPQTEEVRAEGIYTDFEEIPEALLKQIHMDTEKAIADEYYILTDYSLKEEWHPKSVYFLTDSEGKNNRLYDVFEAVFTNGTEEQTVYAAYLYSNVGAEILRAYSVNRTVFLADNEKEAITGMKSVDILYAQELDRLMEKGWSFTATAGTGF